MAFPVPPLTAPVPCVMRVPASKSRVQRRMVLELLQGMTPQLPGADFAPPGDDVRRLHAALVQLGPCRAGHLGTGRERRRLDLGEGATGFRFAMALAALRPAGARTLVTGRPPLLSRPHSALARALGRAGVSIKRRQSGAYRVHGGGLPRHALQVAGAPSSQYASALALALVAGGGGSVERMGECVSDDYYRLTLAMLEEAGATVSPEAGAARTVAIDARKIDAAGLRDEADASAAAAWWVAAAICGADVTIPGLAAEMAQADLRLLPTLIEMGCTVTEDAEGLRLQGPPTLRGVVDIDLRHAPDLLPVVSVLAAVIPGTHRLRNIAHARTKESDRPARMVALLQQVGIAAALEDASTLRVDGGTPTGAAVHVGDDHRLAFAMGILGLRVPGMQLEGLRAAAKSHPSFAEDLLVFGRDVAQNGPRPGP